MRTAWMTRQALRDVVSGGLVSPGRSRLAWLIAACLVAVAMIAPAYSLAAAGITERVSVASDGSQATGGESNAPEISADGRYVAFYSFAIDLVAGDTNGAADVFVHDRETGTTERVSVSSTGTETAGGDRLEPSISADGRYVAFHSTSPDLIEGDTNGLADVFVRDRETSSTVRVSVSSSGTETVGGNSEFPAISADGRYVAFRSRATNLVAGDTNGRLDVFVHDRQSGATERVSVASDGSQATGGDSTAGDISGNGRYVTFHSNAADLVSGDTNGQYDIFVRDRETSATVRVSVASDGGQAGGKSEYPAISADGRHVAFRSEATTLVVGDTNGYRDVFVHDLQAGTTELVSVTSDGSQAQDKSGAPSLSSDGRYIAFRSKAATLVADDTNGVADIFVRDRETSTTARVSTANDGTEGNGQSGSPSISADGRLVAFGSLATTLVAGDTNGYRDIFVFAGDRTPPTTTDDAPSGWQTSDVPVTLEATDTGSGVAATYYSVDGDPMSAYSVPATVSAEGTTTIEYYSVDVAGNQEATQSATVMLDKTPPATSDDVPANPSAPFTITLSAVDAVSGVAETYYTFGDGVMTGSSIPIENPGSYTLRYWSEDVAGNVEAMATVEFDIGVEIIRRGGRDRYQVSADTSKGNFDAADEVILATGWTYADALSASGLAGCLNAPILVTLPERLPSEVEAEIVRLKASKVTIVGGTYSVSQRVEDHLRKDMGLTVDRIGGHDRYEVSEAIAERVRGFGYYDGQVFIASGEVGADALSLSPLVYSARAPLILTRKRVVPSETQSALRASGAALTVLAGGPATVTNENLGRMEKMVGTPIDRLWGNDRYSTAAEVARYGVDSGLASYRYLGVANGADEKFADSLCGGPAVGELGGIMTLTQKDRLPSATRGVLATAKGTTLQVQVFGGPASVSEDVINDIRGLIQ